MAQGNVSIYDNAKFDTFRRKLEVEGVLLRMLWEAKSERHQNVRRQCDVACFAIVGAPKGGTLMVVSYGDHGFATYWEPATNSIDDDDVARILGRKKEKTNGAQR